MPKPPGPPLNPSSELSREHGLALYMTLGQLSLTCARVRLGDRETRITELRQALAAYTNQGNNLWVPFFQGQLAEIEAKVEGSNIALTPIHQALALAGETGAGSDALLHRIRGEILLKSDPANTVPAEQAFLTAVAVAQQQKARSFELRAALLLATLYYRPAAPLRRMRCSRPRSKALYRHRNFRRLWKRRRSLPRLQTPRR